MKKTVLKRNMLENDPKVMARITRYLIKACFKRALGSKHYPLKDFSRGPFALRYFTSKGITVEDLVKVIDDEILDQAVYKSKTNYLKFVDNGVSAINIVASTVNALLNQNLTSHLTDSPGATVIEMNVLANLRKLVGYPCKDAIESIMDIGGYFTTGGMMGDVAALLMARNRLIPSAQQQGIHDVDSFRIIVADFSSHYSSWQAAGWLGLGEDKVMHAKTNGFKYDLAELEKLIDGVYRDGRRVLMVSVTLGNPYTMEIDDISAIRRICDKYGIWLHGDGANGGVLIFADKYRYLVKDVALCDSVSLDPHKAMGLNYPTSIFLCKKYEDFNTVISNWVIINKKDSFDLGSTTPFLNSREFCSLRLWLLFKAFGKTGVAKMIDNKLDTTRRIYRIIKSAGGRFIKFWNDPITFSILFQMVPGRVQQADLNKEYFSELDAAQLEFVTLLAQKGVEIHSFDLPIKKGYPKSEVKGLTKVLCIHNAHERVPKLVLDGLVGAIRDFKNI